MAFALGEQGDQNIGARDLLAARILDMDDRALDHALEAGGRLGVLVVIDHEFGQLGVHIFDQGRAQFVQIDVTGLHHGARILVVHKGEKEVLQGREFVSTLVGVPQSAVQAVFQI